MTERSTAWGPAAAWAGVLFFLSAIPGKDHPPLFFPGEDKVAHLALYAVLGAALAWGRHRSTAPAPRPWVLLGAGALYGLADEGHQALVPGRYVSLGDLAADTAGLALGYWLFTLFLRRLAAPAATRPS